MIYSNNVFTSTPRSSELSLPFRLSDQNLVCISLLFHTCSISGSRVSATKICCGFWWISYLKLASCHFILTPWCRILEELIITQLFKICPHFTEPEGSLPCSQQPANGHYPDLFLKTIHPSPRPSITFRKKLIFGKGLLAPRPTTKLEGHPLTPVRNYLFNILATILNIWRASPPSAIRGRAMPWWQGPTQHVNS